MKVFAAGGLLVNPRHQSKANYPFELKLKYLLILTPSPPSWKIWQARISKQKLARRRAEFVKIKGIKWFFLVEKIKLLYGPWVTLY